MGTEVFQNKIKKGKKNLISDVKGVRVGHKTIQDGKYVTGVTIIDPGSEDIFHQKYVAASHVINGFGKTSGLIQIDELGTLESYIALTNTLSVGTVQQALVKHMLQLNKDIGVDTGTINVVVGECNDGYLNTIRDCIVNEDDVYEAIETLSVDFKEGNVGAGSGMQCFQMKGGIGSSSRVVELDGNEYTIGTLVLSNFGLAKDFTYMDCDLHREEELEKGSIMIVIATDIPLEARQLKRVCKRMHVPLARLGSYMGNGSGDIAIGFSTANKISHYPKKTIIEMKCVHENYMDQIFRAASECCEESILSSLVHSTTTKGRDEHVVKSLNDMIFLR